MADDQDKSKLIFDLKVHAGPAAGASKYKKRMRMFEEGLPQKLRNVLAGFKKNWRQNKVYGLNDRTAIIATIILKRNV